MILGFMQKFPDGTPTNFHDRILASIKDTNLTEITAKYHTVRVGQRWKVGMTIHMGYGVRSKNYFQFNKDIPELQQVKGVQRFDLIFRNRNYCLIFIDRKLFYAKSTNHEFNLSGFYQFCRNDGFKSIDQFWQFFKHPIHNGQLIHWTDLKY